MENRNDRKTEISVGTNQDCTTDIVIADVERLGHCFSYNAAGGVTAICTRTSVDDALEAYNKKVTERVVSASDKITLLVMPTMTFAESESTLRPVHSGVFTHNECLLVNEVLKKMYGGPLNFSYGDREDLKHLLHMKHVLFRRDQRIYVPFSGKSSPIWQLYSRYTKQEALGALLQNIPVL